MSSKKVEAALKKVAPEATVRFGWTSYNGEMVKGYILDMHTGWAKDNGIYMGATLKDAIAHVDQMEVLEDM